MHDIGNNIHVVTPIDKDHLQLFIHWVMFDACRKLELNNNILDGHLKMTVIYTSKQWAPSAGHFPGDFVGNWHSSRYTRWHHTRMLSRHLRYNICF